MTEEVKVQENQENLNDDQQVESTSETQETIQASPAETAAREQGWVPKEEWVAAGKDPSRWRTAEHYVDRGDMLRQLGEAKSYNNRLRETLDSLKQHHANVYTRAHNDALEKLRAMHTAAVREGEAETATRLVDEIAAEKDRFAQESARIAAVNAAPAPTPPEVATWKTKNQWYEEDEDMRAVADAIALKYAQKVVREENRVPTPNEVLTHLDQKIADKFQPKRPTAAPNPVQSGNAAPARGTKGGLTEKDLTAQERKAMNDFIEWGVFKTKADYIKELEKTR